MRSCIAHTVLLNGRKLDYQLVESAAAKHLRVRIKPQSVEVLQPNGRSKTEVQCFLRDKTDWIESQIERVQKLNGVHKRSRPPANTISLRGERLRLVIEKVPASSINRILLGKGSLTVLAGRQCPTPPQTTLSNWLRRQAREEIMRQLPEICVRVRRRPKKIFVMGQRTKWGNCSAKHTLSFNWRLIMAPPQVMSYLITHEVVHLAVPDHSAKFWLTLKSLCPDSERARQWLAANGSQLLEPLASIL